MTPTITDIASLVRQVHSYGAFLLVEHHKLRWERDWHIPKRLRSAVEEHAAVIARYLVVNALSGWEKA